MDSSQAIVRRIELVGDYDFGQRARVTALFDALSPDGPATIDMTKVTFVDSSFLHELTKLRTRLTPHRITLVVHNENVRRLLGVVGFKAIFDIQPSSEGR